MKSSLDEIIDVDSCFCERIHEVLMIDERGNEFLKSIEK